MGRSKRVEIWRFRCQTRRMADEAHPRHSDRVVILGRRAMVLREGLNSLHHEGESLFFRKTTRIDPSQTDVLPVAEHLVGNLE